MDYPATDAEWLVLLLDETEFDVLMDGLCDALLLVEFDVDTLEETD